MRRGFSLIEVLVVLGVISLLLSMLLPAIQHARAAADKVACQSNLRQIGLALHLYHQDVGHLPPHRSPSPWLSSPDSVFTWSTLILAYIDQQPLWQDSLIALRTTTNCFQSPPHRGLGTLIPIYRCPTDGRMTSTHASPSGAAIAFTSYLGVAGGANNVFDGTIGCYPDGASFASIFDGLSNTVMVGERPPPDEFDAGFCYTRVSNGGGYSRSGPHNAMPMFTGGAGAFMFGPGRTDNPGDKMHFWSLHPKGANFLFADGSVRFISYSARGIMISLATRNGGEFVELPD